MDELSMLSFVGIYFLLLGGFVYNFYLSKKIYRVLDLMVEVMNESTNPKNIESVDTMKNLMTKGMELEQQSK